MLWDTEQNNPRGQKKSTFSWRAMVVEFEAIAARVATTDFCNYWSFSHQNKVPRFKHAVILL